MSFDGKTVIVTGATSGIGRATAEAFGQAGAAVVIVGRNEEALGEVGKAITSAGGRSVPCAADVTASDAARHIVQTATDAFGGVDVLVNAAGVIASGTLDVTSDDTWDRMLAVNATAPFRLMRAAAPSLIASKGSIVNVSSVNGLRAFAGVLAYCVSKAAVDHLTRCAALEMAPHGVRVNAVNPGVTVTRLTAARGWTNRVHARSSRDRRKRIRLAGPAGPRRSPSSFCSLASDQASWMTERDSADRRRPHRHRAEACREMPDPTGSLGLSASTNTSPSRSASVRTAVNPPALNAGPGSNGATFEPPPRIAARPWRGPAPMIITRPPPRSTRHIWPTAAERSSPAQPAEQSAGVVDDRQIERSASSGSEVNGAVSISTRRPARLRPLRGARRDSASGTTATARPDKPDFRGDRGQAPPCAQPICTRRSRA
jgi:NAD(P)-dependent dehydrogenase (short-subunit alcohol dehydrogenase family)